MSHRHVRPHLLMAALLAALAPAAHAGEVVYRGQLDDRGAPANGRFDLRIAAFGDEKSPQTLLAPIEFPGVEVKDGRFELRFDAPLAGDREAWLEVAVRDAGASAWAGIPGRSKALAAPLIGACWSSTGDSGTDSLLNFLGTTDAQPLVLRTHGAPHLKILPSDVLVGGTFPINASIVAGSSSNFVGGATQVRGATISGGGAPEGDSDPDPEVVGEGPNRVSDHYGTVGGGINNLAGNGGGGSGDAVFATVGGGSGNIAGGRYSVVGGGIGNYATGVGGMVAGGASNGASGDNSIAVGGSLNCAGGTHSWAAGSRAKARPGSLSGFAGGGCVSVPVSGTLGDEGTFVWADRQAADFISTGANQFLVRAQGGVAINTNTPAAGTALTVAGGMAINTNTPTAGTALTVAGHVSVPNSALYFGSATRQMLNLFGTSFGSGVQLNTHYFRSGTGFAWFQGGSHNDGENNPGAGGSVLMTLTPNGISPALTYSGRARAQNFENVSDRAVKTDFLDVDVGAVLGQVIRLPLSSWRYIDAPGERHLGPVAQDFRALFGLGASERTISTVDSAGVALAAIQGLNAKLESENAALREDNQVMRADNAAIRSELAALRTLVESRLPKEH
ncbi:MAG: tail fiber domain-containing protein [Rhodanobacteraceae bacterium]|nr:tail fiber domain-containing protein [Rhodanobacteraceae bacterium]